MRYGVLPYALHNMVTRVRTPDAGGGPWPERRDLNDMGSDGIEHLPSGSVMISPELGNYNPTFSSGHCDGTNWQERNGKSLQSGGAREGSQLPLVRSCIFRRLW